MEVDGAVDDKVAIVEFEVEVVVEVKVEVGIEVEVEVRTREHAVADVAGLTEEGDCNAGQGTDSLGFDKIDFGIVVGVVGVCRTDEVDETLSDLIGLNFADFFTGSIKSRGSSALRLRSINDDGPERTEPPQLGACRGGSSQFK